MVLPSHMKDIDLFLYLNNTFYNLPCQRGFSIDTKIKFSLCSNQTQRSIPLRYLIRPMWEIIIKKDIVNTIIVRRLKWAYSIQSKTLYLQRTPSGINLNFLKMLRKRCPLSNQKANNKRHLQTPRENSQGGKSPTRVEEWNLAPTGSCCP